MDSVNRFGPELILLSAAGGVILAGICWALAGPRGGGGGRGVRAALARAGAAASIGWSALLIAFDKRGEAFDGMMTVDDFSLFFNFLFAGIVVIVGLPSLALLRENRFVAGSYGRG